MSPVRRHSAVLMLPKTNLFSCNTRVPPPAGLGFTALPRHIVPGSYRIVPRNAAQLSLRLSYDEEDILIDAPRIGPLQRVPTDAASSSESLLQRDTHSRLRRERLHDVRQNSSLRRRRRACSRLAPLAHVACRFHLVRHNCRRLASKDRSANYACMRAGVLGDSAQPECGTHGTAK